MSNECDKCEKEITGESFVFRQRDNRSREFFFCDCCADKARESEDFMEVL